MEVAEICLGNMEDARAARALRETRMKEPQLEAQIAMLAIQLGLREEAERLYLSCRRYDLLSEMYQATDQWEKALAIAEKHDRVNMCTTHYKYARHLESMGDLKGAIAQYEKSKTHSYEVPRMLFDAGRIPELEEYVAANRSDKQLLNWWAKYCEGNGEYQEAINLYTECDDFLSQVRLYCYIGTLKKAAEIVLKSNDKAAAYHLARQLEIAGKFQHAISYYKQAETYQHAIRLAKEKDLQQEVMQLALQSPPRVMIDAAQYFEEKGQMDKAVQLYQRGGHVAKAIDMCVQGKLFDVLASIADDIFRDNTSDPEVLRKCAEVFIQHERYDRSVQMYTRSGNYASALELCMKKNVKISEEMAEELTPPKNDDDEEYTKKRTQILRKIAKVAAMQENYTVATKKYVQAGDKLKAMKVLIKSGDTEKIIFFAVISRQRELYILAANYLQNLDWRNEPEIMKSIISFYTKAKAWKFLSNFYEACSSVEIDEYRHYEKALDALKEAQKYMTKEFKGLQPGTTQQQVAEKITQLKQRIVLVDKFILARELAKKSQDNVSGEMVKICQELLNEPSAEEAIRVGDVYALLVEFYWVQQGDGRQAYQLIQKMRDHKIILNFYLDEKMISEIYADVGVQYPTQQAAPEDGDEIEEELHYD
jgi:intraflagellar transport protein 140